LKEAADCHRRSLELSPDAAGTHYNLALVLRDSGDIAAAMQQFECAVELGYNSSDLYWDRALAYLTDGKLAPGFAEYEWRWRLPEITARSLPGAPWKGESLKGRTLFVYAEQGFGDTIQFARYVPVIAGQAGRVIFECQASLLRLLSGSERFAGVELIPQGEQVPTFDFHTALLSLPHLVGTTLSTIPADIPYISPPSGSDKPPAPRAGPSVGLAWTGKPTHRNDRNRSITLAQLAPLLQLPHVHFVSLQVGTAAQEIAALGYGSVIENRAPALKDFADTASAIQAVDLVISIDSAVAHLAGALGRPVWTLIPYVPDWRWMLLRDDSPWYPTMRLMRQRAPGDWADLLQRVGERLSQYRAV
jgi:tetratricopeptide (TPR) repeat protein